MLAVAQCFALMPVVGIRGPDFKQSIQFRWRTLRVLFTVCLILCGVCVDLLYLKRIMRIGINAKNIGKLTKIAILANYITVKTNY